MARTAAVAPRSAPVVHHPREPRTPTIAKTVVPTRHADRERGEDEAEQVGTAEGAEPDRQDQALEPAEDDGEAQREPDRAGHTGA